MSYRLVELQERFCELVDEMCQVAYEHDASEVAQIYHCSKDDAEWMQEWGYVFPDGGIEPAHFKISPKLNVIKAILQTDLPYDTLDWAMTNDAGSKAIKRQFGVPMTTQKKDPPIYQGKAKTEKRGDGMFMLTVPMDVDLPKEVEVIVKEVKG